jgi:capsular polysaccharide export protein
MNMSLPPDAATDAPRRTFLFLQGPSSYLFARIADNLERRGHRCLRINLCMGDWVFWRRPGAVNYRGRVEDWPEYVSAFMDREAVTDLILLGEERPHHRAASQAAAKRGMPVFAVEMGYLRPDWIRIEKGGSGFNSHFPIDPKAILQAGRDLPEPDFDQRFAHTFATDAKYDLMFNLPNVFLWFFYPHYRWHAIFHPLAEYAGWGWRLLRSRGHVRRTLKITNRMELKGQPFFIFPLQLETDYQIRAYSTFNSQREAIDMVVESFANNAEANVHLLIKVHPLDNNLIDWRRYIRDRARERKLGRRIHFVDGGNLTRMIEQSRGLITINSTAAMVALQQGRPVKTLGISIYDVPGLTTSSHLDAFWREAEVPDPDLVDAFIRLVAASLHERVNFSSDEGVDAAAASIARRLHENRVNQPGGYVAEPQRARPQRQAERSQISPQPFSP